VTKTLSKHVEEITPHRTAWRLLRQSADEISATHLRDLFAADPDRFKRFSLTLPEYPGWLLDFSKQRVSSRVISGLHALWAERRVEALIARMRDGLPINHTEQRAVLHFALRQSSDTPVRIGNQDVMPAIRSSLAQIARFCNDIHQGLHTGSTGKRIRHIINLGIGGSDLGPKSVARALAAHRMPAMTVEFVSNLDAAHLARALAGASPEETLFIIASKTFTTQETLQNAISARHWLTSALGESAIASHFVAVSANIEGALAFGIQRENIFAFWDWVGGRFSVWSAIGLPLALSIGFDQFRQFLEGAESMDRHFFNTPVQRNLPATLALIDFWNSSFLNAETRAVLPYSQSLSLLPRFLQQLEMESNGKKTDRDGKPISMPTCPVVWGEAGTNGQHAFYQLLHQGGRFIPCEFIGVINPDYEIPGHHEKLLAHCLAQSEALMRGKTREEMLTEEKATGSDVLSAYRSFHGNQPSSTLLIPDLKPHTLGQLFALYEHKVFTLGALWNINAFDQWGVEYGKQLAGRLAPVLQFGASVEGLDSSTSGLVATILANRSPQRR
jgi:glucose-6-phosphate isomerase